MTTFVLVPGAGGSGWYWHTLAAELARRGHDAVPVDLPADDDSVGPDVAAAARQRPFGQSDRLEAYLGSR